MADAVLRLALLQTDLHTGHGTRRIPDFVKLAESMGCVGLRCETDADVDATIKQANEINDQPVVVDFTVSQATRWCGPWSPRACPTTKSSTREGVAPTWDRED